MTEGYLSRIFPLVEKAADAARERARRAIVDSHLLWMVYVQERERLLDEAARVKNGQPISTGEVMSESEFEEFLRDRGVWVETESDTDA